MSARILNEEADMWVDKKVCTVDFLFKFISFVIVFNFLSDL